MRVGIVLGNVQAPESGGGFTFQDSIMQALLEVATDHEIVVFHDGSKIDVDESSVSFVSLDSYKPKSVLKDHLPMPVLRLTHALCKVGRYLMGRPSPKMTSALERAAQDYKVELIWFATPRFIDTSLPYVTTVWDLAHRTDPIFPEVRRTGWEWEAREQHYRRVLPKAAYVITGTEAGKAQIMKYYQVNERRVKVIPFPTPAFALDSDPALAPSIDLPDQFLFYPAQFWPHKNHVLVLDALRVLRTEYGLDMPAVFTGSDKGNLTYVKQIARDTGVDDLTLFLGFVSRKRLTYLYQQAFALVFVTFFGPDNLPPLEAFALGCPVIASDIPGAREQLGNAAVLVNPVSAEALSEAIHRLAEAPSQRQSLVEQGYKRARQWQDEDYVLRMLEVVEECVPYRRCWSPDDDYKHA